MAAPTGAGGWTGYTAGGAWIGYAPQTAWSGYSPGASWRVSPIYGFVRSPSRYREYGTGRNVPLSKPWLPGSL